MSPDAFPRLLILLFLIGTVGSSVARANETAIKLKDSPELVKVKAYCGMCHSLDYIPMNAPFLDRAAWDAEVRKMVKAMGAPIPEADIGPIVDYLARNYGKPD